LTFKPVRPYIKGMQIFKTFQNLPDEAKGAVITIGNFDGVHNGHRFIIKRTREIARETGKKMAVMTFEPHPRRLFRPDEPPGRLTPFDVKAWRLEEEGADILFSLPFDWDFASQSADDFIFHVLKQGAGASHVVVGHDFKFGQLRKGDPEHIREAGVPTTVIEEVNDEGGMLYSSSRVRQELRHGNIKEANDILGWKWEIRGEVVKGDRRGHELGYPTANIKFDETMHPAYGVYAARVAIGDEKEWHDAAINIGIRPMFEIPEAQLESHIFNFSREIYGKTLRVQPVQRLRSEAKFSSVDQLKKQMAEDCRQAEEILKNK
jgi:riboflavin kinase / FMN adenylyltransferase